MERTRRGKTSRQATPSALQPTRVTRVRLLWCLLLLLMLLLLLLLLLLLMLLLTRSTVFPIFLLLPESAVVHFKVARVSSCCCCRPGLLVFIDSSLSFSLCRYLCARFSLSLSSAFVVISEKKILCVRCSRCC